MKEIIFSSHAEAKFSILRRHGFDISRDTIISTLENPESVESGYKGRKIAQSTFDEMHVIRVVYEDLPVSLRVITFYPGRRQRYEN